MRNLKLSLRGFADFLYLYKSVQKFRQTQQACRFQEVFDGQIRLQSPIYTAGFAVYITLGLAMALQLFELPQFPGRTAATEMGSFVPEGIFFLDFSRPLETHKWFGVRNQWLGPPIALFVPVVHEGEREGGYVVGVDRSSPYFEQLRSLWQQRYPSKQVGPTVAADHLKIVADFANQFPSQV